MGTQFGKGEIIIGPGGISKGSYDPTKLSQEQRNWLWNQFGHGGQAPVGYGGEGGGGSTGGGISGFNIPQPQTPDYEAITRRAIELQKEAAQPAIASYQAQIPETQQRFTAERQRLQAEQEPLERRYQNLLDQVTSRQQTEEQRTGIATSAELGRRGISSQSGLYAQEINKALSPITQFYTGQAKELGISQEDAMRNLQNLISNVPLQETEAIRAINNAIAQLQAGAGQAGISSGLQQFQMQQQANQQAAQFALQQVIAQAQQQYQQQQLGFSQQQAEREAQAQQLAYELQKRMFEEVTLPQSKYELGKPYYKSETGSGTGTNPLLPSGLNRYQIIG